MSQEQVLQYAQVGVEEHINDNLLQEALIEAHIEGAEFMEEVSAEEQQYLDEVAAVEALQDGFFKSLDTLIEDYVEQPEHLEQ